MGKKFYINTLSASLLVKMECAWLVHKGFWIQSIPLGRFQALLEFCMALITSLDSSYISNILYVPHGSVLGRKRFMKIRITLYCWARFVNIINLIYNIFAGNLMNRSLLNGVSRGIRMFKFQVLFLSQVLTLNL